MLFSKTEERKRKLKSLLSLIWNIYNERNEIKKMTFQNSHVYVRHTTIYIYIPLTQYFFLLLNRNKNKNKKIFFVMIEDDKIGDWKNLKKLRLRYLYIYIFKEFFVSLVDRDAKLNGRTFWRMAKCLNLLAIKCNRTILYVLSALYSDL